MLPKESGDYFESVFVHSEKVCEHSPGLFLERSNGIEIPVCRGHDTSQGKRGRQLTEQMLMYWCLRARDVATRLEHRDLRFPKSLPSIAQIQAQAKSILGGASAGPPSKKAQLAPSGAA